MFWKMRLCYTLPLERFHTNSVQSHSPATRGCRLKEHACVNPTDIERDATALEKRSWHVLSLKAGCSVSLRVFGNFCTGFLEHRSSSFCRKELVFEVSRILLGS